MYASEVIQPKYRAGLSGSVAASEILGSLCTYFLGYYTTSLTIALYFGVLSLALFLLVYTIPESPYWYMLRQEKENAAKALNWLRQNDEKVVSQELEEIQETLGESENSMTFTNVIFKVDWWKNFILFSIFVTLFSETGFDMIIPYSKQFFATVNRTRIENGTLAVIFMTMALVGTIVSMFFVDKIRRKPLLQNTYFFNFVLLIVACTSESFSYIKSSSEITLCCIFMYATTVSITIFSVPWTVINESISTESRATLFAAISAYSSIVYFLNTELFPLLLHEIGINVILWLFGLFSLLNGIFVAFFIKETKDTILPGNRKQIANTSNNNCSAPEM